MTPLISFEKFQQFYRILFDKMSSVALTTNDGLTLYIKYNTLVEIGSLPVAAQTVQRYLNLQNGEIAIINDPYSGGTTLSSVNLVLAITDKKNKEGKLLIVKKIPFKPKVYLGKNIEEEGVRIPPTPILSNGKLNIAVLNAISDHPLAPANFKDCITQAILSLQALEKKYFDLQSVFDLELNKVFFKELIAHQTRQMKALIAEIRNGEKIQELTLSDGSRLRLRVDVTEEKVLFDFSGSELSEDIHMTHSATIGACTGALVALFDRDVEINSGIFQCIDVTAPEGTTVHAKYPMPVFFGMTDGAATIANLVLKAIGEIDKTKRFPLSGTSECSFEIEFKGQNFFETLESGSPASPTKDGVDGLALWRRSQLKPSVEEIEKIYPLTVDSFSVRPDSNGEGRYSGGRGVVKSFTLKEPAHLKWTIFEPNEKPLGAAGGKDGEAAEIYLQKVDGEKQLLAKRGRIELAVGDKVIVYSSGGGGFGEEPS